MRLLAIDYGTKKSGIAISDPLKIIAQPLTTIFYDKNNFEFLLNEIKKIIEINKPIEKIILGLPKNMNNTMGERCSTTIQFQQKLIDIFNIEVVLQDERLTTVEATNYMLQADISRKKRKKSIDSLAANIILQTYLDREKGGKLWEKKQWLLK